VRIYFTYSQPVVVIKIVFLQEQFVVPVTHGNYDRNYIFIRLNSDFKIVATQTLMESFSLNPGKKLVNESLPRMKE